MNITKELTLWQPDWSLWLHHTVTWLPKIVIAVLLFVFWRLCARIVGRTIRKMSNHCAQRQALLTLTGRYVEYSIIIAGLLTILATLGVDITALVASIGLAGLTIGFALKDALSNICSGFMLICYRPFGIGDEIHIQHGSQSYSGQVLDINLRYTVIQNETAQTVMVPNNIVLNNTLTLTTSDTPPTS